MNQKKDTDQGISESIPDIQGCDGELGIRVNDHLQQLGIQTPLTDEVRHGSNKKIIEIGIHMTKILQILGLDLADDSIEETPFRVAKMYVNEIFSGLRTETFPRCTMVENKFCTGDEFVLEKNITLFSDCEHHLRPIIGKVHIAYIPKDHVLGLSKLNRVAQYFGRRPQVQERLTQQIAHALSYIIVTQDIMVVVDAEHTCVSQRGVMDTNSSTQTACVLGQFAEHNSPLRKEVVSAFLA